VPGWVSHLELGWALPAERASMRALRLDAHWCGMTGPAVGCPIPRIATTSSTSTSRSWEQSRPR
jgi:hypothetical protein